VIRIRVAVGQGSNLAGDWRHPETHLTIGETAVRVSRHGLLLYAPPAALKEAGTPEPTTGGGS
jgi:hypothetical protein